MWRSEPIYPHRVVTEEGFVPHKPDPALYGTTILYAVRLDAFGNLSVGDQNRLAGFNPHGF